MKFWVIAGNIHGGFVDHYGPYTWPARLTYEGLQSNIEEDEHFQIFTWHDPQDVGKGNPHGYESWTDSEGDTRYDGWRLNKHVITERTEHGFRSHIEPVGPFYTDLDLTLDDPR